MAERKTKPTEASVEDFLNGTDDEDRREDCRTLEGIMQQATRPEPKMWGGSIIGFGSYHYKYDSGREADWFLSGSSPRKRELSLYLMSGFDGREALLAGLGKFKTGKSCLKVKRLADVDLAVLKKLISASVKHLRRTQKQVDGDSKQAARKRGQAPSRACIL